MFNKSVVYFSKNLLKTITVYIYFYNKTHKYDNHTNLSMEKSWMVLHSSGI